MLLVLSCVRGIRSTFPHCIQLTASASHQIFHHNAPVVVASCNLYVNTIQSRPYDTIHITATICMRHRSTPSQAPHPAEVPPANTTTARPLWCRHHHPLNLNYCVRCPQIYSALHSVARTTTSSDIQQFNITNPTGRRGPKWH